MNGNGNDGRPDTARPTEELSITCRVRTSGGIHIMAGITQTDEEDFPNENVNYTMAHQRTRTVATTVIGLVRICVVLVAIQIHGLGSKTTVGQTSTGFVAKTGDQKITNMTAIPTGKIDVTTPTIGTSTEAGRGAWTGCETKIERGVVRGVTVEMLGTEGIGIEAGTEAETGAGTGAGTGAEIGAGTGTEIGVETEAETEAGTGAEAGAETKAETELEAEIGAFQATPIGTAGGAGNDLNL